jgi:L-alanine-DL-glutamate epimerase-like enolase superfamily enzyme
MNLAKTAEANNVSMYAYLAPGIGLNIMAAISNRVNFVLSFEGDNDPLRERLWKNAAVAKNGYMKVPDGAGFGMKLDRSTIDELKVDE